MNPPEICHCSGAPDRYQIEATKIRSRMLLAFEKAEREPDADVRHAWLAFVKVGAGPTGVELAGALGKIAVYTLKDNFRYIDPSAARTILLDESDRVLHAIRPISPRMPSAP